MSEDADQEVAVFCAARQLTGVARDAFLDRACAGDTRLRRRIDELLLADNAAAAFLEKPAGASPNSVLRTAETRRAFLSGRERSGDRIGPYTLIKEIGEGGCGVVYLARQERPIRRCLALKIIKPGMDTRQVVARFEGERQALAMMDHPNIARVLDAGATETGLPFFAMELVPGVKITEFCDRERLTIAERLGLFTLVCGAIQHAHQKGVIHRDIKPSNVLVSRVEGVAVPKVIDFGVAKATQGRLGDQTVLTAVGHIVGTPAYMSPEQAVAHSVDVDTRSDIYSLGVLLYELLTGLPPFSAEALLEAGWHEMSRTIRVREPDRPSTKLAGMDFLSLAATADKRGAEPSKLIRSVRGDLDCIAMKCLEKDRAKRYETVVGLARDVRRHLENEAITARPAGGWSRFQKLVLRHRLAFLAAFAVVVSLVLCVVIAVFAAFRIEEARTRVQLAKDDATEKLWGSYLAESRARRAGGQAGRRFGSLEALSNAAAIHPSIAVRNEAVAALALSDIRVSRFANFKWSGPDENARFDSLLKRYAVGEPDGSISVHDGVTGRVTAILPPTGSAVAGVAFLGNDRYLEASYKKLPDGELWVWDIQRQTPVLKALTGAWYNDTSCDGRLFAFNNPDGTLSVYDLEAQREVRRLGLDRAFESYGFDFARSRLVAFTVGESLAGVYEIESGRCLLSLTNPAALTASPVWSPDGRILAMPCMDQKVYLTDARTGEPTARLEGHAGRVTQAIFSHSGEILATSSWDDTIRLWDPTTGGQILRMAGGARGFGFSPDDRFLGAIMEGPRFGLAEVVVSRECRTLRGKVESQNAVGPVFSPDGRFVAAGSGPRVCLWNTASGMEIGSFAIAAGDTLLVPPDGTGLITTERSGGVYLRSLLWSSNASADTLILGKRQKIVECEDPRGGVLTPDGRFLAVPGFGSGTIKVIEFKTGGVRAVIRGAEAVDYLALSPNGRCLVSGSWQHSGLNVWNVPSGKLEKSVATETRARPKYSPDGRWLAVISKDYTILDARSMKPCGPPIQGSNWMQFNELDFSPDGSLLALVQSGHRILLQETSSWKEVAALEAPDLANIQRITFSPDSSALAVLGQDQRLRLWDLRLIRRELRGMNLDWDLPPYPPAAAPLRTVSLQAGE